MKNTNANKVAAYGKLVGICSDLGASYNPGKASLKTTAMTTLLQQAQLNDQAVNDAYAAYILAIKTRSEAFSGISRLASRIVRVVTSFETSHDVIGAMKTLNRKFYTRSRNIVTPVNAAGEPVKKETHVSSRLDYNSRIETLDTMVGLLQRITAYNPNEADLKVAALKLVITDLRTKCDNAIKALNTLNKVKQTRRQTMSGPAGVFETATAAKEYIRGVFGVRSSIARQANQAVIKI
jgi:hypothetical protein